MPRNGSGVYSLPSNSFNPAVADTEISETDWNEAADDIETGITDSIAKDGQTTITANLPMAGFRHTGVGEPTARTQYATVAGLQDGKWLWVDGGGTADAITATYSPALTTVVDGQFCFVRATAANTTTTPTFAPNGLTARTIVKRGGVALVAGDIRADGHELILRYDLTNTRWELLNPAIVSGDLPGSGQISAAGLLGLGMTPSTIVDITQTQNNPSVIQLLNNSNGASASADLRLKNNVASLFLATLYGSGVSTSFPTVSDGALIDSSGAGGLVLNSSTTAGVKLGHNSAQVAVTTTRGLSVGNGTDTTEANPFLTINASGYSGFHWADGTAYYIGQNSAGRTLRMYSGATPTTGVELTNGATAWASTSDERKKDIFEPIIGGLKKVCSLRAVIGKFKTDDDGVRRSFLIAQDVQNVLPEAVSEDAEGILSLRYSDVIPLLVSALKDANERISALEKKVA